MSWVGKDLQHLCSEVCQAPTAKGWCVTEYYKISFETAGVALGTKPDTEFPTPTCLRACLSVCLPICPINTVTKNQLSEQLAQTLQPVGLPFRRRPCPRRQTTGLLLQVIPHLRLILASVTIIATVVAFTRGHLCQLSTLVLSVRLPVSPDLCQPRPSYICERPGTPRRQPLGGRFRPAPPH